MNGCNISGGPLKGSTDTSKLGTHDSVSRTVARGLDGEGAIDTTIIIEEYSALFASEER